MTKGIKPVSFSWFKACGLYELREGTVLYKAGGADPHRPVLGSFECAPNTGQYFYEFRVNCDNARVGVATAAVDLSGEMGKVPHCWSINLQTGIVEYNGEEKKRLWRLLTPVSGGVCGFVVDTNQGTLQFYFNGEFQGTAVTTEFSFQGAAVYPCVGVAGVELNNRDIGVGKKGAFVTMQPKVYRTLV
jgi:hypothetical protein